MERQTQLAVAPFAATATSRVASTRPGSPQQMQGAPKIRVLHILPSVALGGIEEGVLSLLRTLDRNRFSPMLACPPKLIEAHGHELAEIDVEVYPLERLVRPSQVLVIAQLVRVLRAAAPDIVHTHLFVTSLCVAPVAKLLGVRTLVESCRIREGWRGNIWKRYWIDRLVNRLVDANVANSDALRRYLLDVKRFPKDKVTIIRNGRDLSRVLAPPVNEETALREEFHLNPRDTVVVAPGRLEIQKGHSYLLEALPKVLGRFPDLRLLIVGEGSLRGPLAAQITKLNLQDHVTLTGYRKDVYDLFRLSDLIVLPSLFEGLPLVAIEAGALSKTILATRVDGTPEVVLHGVTGWLVPPANSADLAQAMCRLLGDAELRARLGKQAQMYIAQEYSFDRLVVETERLYVKLASQSRPENQEVIRPCAGSQEL
jgi:glycosyltransferase involved in cell wall biosynthesis